MELSYLFYLTFKYIYIYKGVIHQIKKHLLPQIFKELFIKINLIKWFKRIRVKHIGLYKKRIKKKGKGTWDLSSLITLKKRAKKL